MKAQTSALLAVAVILSALLPNLAHAARSTPVEIVNDETSPVPVIVQSSGPWKQFVGFSDTQLDGGAGWPAVNAACSSKFGAGARLCAADEIYVNGGPTVPMAGTRIRAFVHSSSPGIAAGWYGGAPCARFELPRADEPVRYILDSDDGRIKYAYAGSAESATNTDGSCASTWNVACCK